MPRGKYPRKKTTKVVLTPTDKADLKRATEKLTAGVADGAPQGFTFEAPARPYRQYMTTIHYADRIDRNIIGSSELIGELIERLRINNPTAVRINVLLVRVEQILGWSLEQDPF